MSGLVTRIKGTPPYRGLRRAKVGVERLIFERGDFQDTSEKVELDEFGLEDPERTGYEPSSWSFLRKALRHCEVRSTDVFLDLGSGKGRVVWQAAQQPFARVIGVEISPELNAVAQRNLERNRERMACGDFELVTADAAFYEIPDDVTFVYLFSPFRGRTFRRVVANLISSLDREERDLTLIYANPAMHDHLDATGRFDLTHSLSSARPDAGETSSVNLYRAQSRAEAESSKPESPRVKKLGPLSAIVAIIAFPLWEFLVGDAVAFLAYA